MTDYIIGRIVAYLAMLVLGIVLGMKMSPVPLPAHKTVFVDRPVVQKVVVEKLVEVPIYREHEPTWAPIVCDQGRYIQ